jgi:hypothetical protein
MSKDSDVPLFSIDSLKGLPNSDGQKWRMFTYSTADQVIQAHKAKFGTVPTYLYEYVSSTNGMKAYFAPIGDSQK